MPPPSGEPLVASEEDETEACGPRSSRQPFIVAKSNLDLDLYEEVRRRR